MDQLLKDRQEFKRRLQNVPVIDIASQFKRSWAADSTFDATGSSVVNGAAGGYDDSHRNSSRRFSAFNDDFDYKTVSTIPSSMDASQSKFAIVTRIIKYMKKRHLDGDHHPLTVEDILDEMNESHTVKPSMVKWLQTEALPHNPKLQQVDNAFTFKPRYQVKNTAELETLLRQYWEEGKGAIVLDDLMESYPDVQRSLKRLESKIIRIENTNKSVNIFYKYSDPLVKPVDEKFKGLWNSINVEGVPEEKIEEYLRDQGIRLMSGERSNRFVPGSNSSQLLADQKMPNCQRQKRRRVQPLVLKTNRHLDVKLEDYSGGAASGKSGGSKSK